MSHSLIIVESPAKARTIGKYLGKDFKIEASVGHVKDLPKKTLGVDIENDFDTKYEVIRGKGKLLKKIRDMAGKADAVYLAPDPDREGEAIAWHIADEIRKKNENIHRVMFHEITRKAVQAALEKPEKLDRSKYDSQQARRILDRLVGYQISPILWRKVKRGLSAGRVQSVAVELVVEREKKIRAFDPVEYWVLGANLKGSKEPGFFAKLSRTDGKKSEVSNGDDAAAIVEELQSNPFLLAKIEKKERKRHPLPPFITARLQQEAARYYRFTAKRTMQIAQRLYEGIDLGPLGTLGLITYMRTDSTRVSPDAIGEVRTLISRDFGPKYLPAKPNSYRNKKNSQDAHEAIRPTDLNLAPEKVAPYLEKDQLKLYTLIWKRFIASQMTSAIFDATGFDVECGRHMLRATGQVMRFDGFMAIYREAKEEDPKNGNGDDDQNILPDLVEGEVLKLEDLSSEQKFTQPPPRFTEATLVREMEEKGIGRPSTYASILSTIQDKEYTKKIAGRFHPTELGELVTELLLDSFPRIMDVEFTAQMEENLDEVEEGRRNYLDLLRDFYLPFKDDLGRAEAEMRDVKRHGEPTNLNCPECGRELVIKWGKNGSFIGCSGYNQTPRCEFTSEYKRDPSGKVQLKEPEMTEVLCKKCGSPMIIKNSRYGRFMACSAYPKCNHTEPIDTGVPCPEEGCKGSLVEKLSRKGRVFYGCNQFPSCRYATWNKPVDIACPSCGFPHMEEKPASDGRPRVSCPKCKYKLNQEEIDGISGEETDAISTD